MNTIAFLDIETDIRSGKILDLGCVDDEKRQVHSTSVSDLIPLFKGKQFLCGHNFVKHDWTFLKHHLETLGFSGQHLIDTLFWSPLLFPSKPYHSLVKDDKLEYDDDNNLINDVIKARNYWTMRFLLFLL